MADASATQLMETRAFKNGSWSSGARELIGEIAIAIVVDGGAEAVMMATNADLEDFILGFALTEGLVKRLEDIKSLEFANSNLGVEARLWLREDAAAQHNARRRRRAGPAGCGLCGVESLEEAMRPLSPVGQSIEVHAINLIDSMHTLAARQPLNAATRAAHAAAFYLPERGLALVREDIGRHNALDKLAGALVRTAADDAGAVLMTSRVSVELVQKTAYLGASILAAISAPSTLAVRAADAAGITLCGIVRDDGLEVFTHPQRIL